MAVFHFGYPKIVWVNYFTSTLAPASSKAFLIASASSLPIPSLTGFGAPSTKSFASFKPKPVKSFTTFTTPNLAAPASLRITSKVVLTAAASAPPPPATTTAAAAGSIPY